MKAGARAIAAGLRRAALGAALTSLGGGGCGEPPRLGSAACAASGWAEAGPAQARRAEAGELLPGVEVERALEVGESHLHTLRLEAGHYLELVAVQRGVDLAIALCDPAGRLLAEVDSPTGPVGEERLTAVAAAGGVHRLAVEERGGESGGSYALAIAELRPATEADRGRVEADRLFAAGERLRERGDREAGRRAVERYREALAAIRRLGDPRREAQVNQRLGWTHRKNLDEKRLAVPYLSRAAALFGELGDSAEQASALNQLGRVHYDLGEVEAAQASYEQALPLWRRAGDGAGEAATLSNLALVFRTHGEVQVALDFYDQALARLRRLGARADETRVLYNRGQFYRLLGKERVALDDLRASLALAIELGEKADEASALTAIGQAHQQLGELDAAREVLEHALALRREVGQPRGVALVLRTLGMVDAAAGREAQALAAFEEALALFRGLEARREEAGVLTQLGWLHASAGRFDPALDLLRPALAQFEAMDHAAGQSSTLLAIAHAERGRGDLAAAHRHALLALDGVEQLRRAAVSQDLRSAWFARQQDHFDFLIDLLMERDRLDPAAGFSGEALAVAERSRARSLLETLVEAGAEPRRGANPRSLVEERELERRLASLEQRRALLSDRESSPEQQEALERDLRQALGGLERVRARIRAESPRYAALTQPRPLSLPKIQREVLDEGTLLLQYDLGPEASYLWVVSPRASEAHVLPGRQQIEDAAREAYRLLSQSARREAAWQTTAALEELSEVLLGPAAARLDGQRLLVVGEGALQYIPFGALPRPRPPGPGSPAAAAPLLAAHEVVGMPSASALAVLRRQLADRAPAPRAAAVLADPVFGPEVARLAHSRREAEAIHRLLPAGESLLALGFAADRELVAGGDLAPYRILHFATHGELDSAHPELSRLVFSQLGPRGEPRNGLLFAHEIYDLELPAELVVLSGCQTALGAEIRGEGLVGLTHAFFYAGAAQVLVSLWQVDDEATAELMARFYRALLVERLRPAAALRAAQRSIREEPGWEAPYYWAGFVLQGEWRASVIGSD